MNRRTFVQSAMLTGAAVASHTPAAVTGKDRQQWYELRTYLFTSDAQRQLTDDYVGKVLVPALNRLGVPAVGVFSELQPQGIAKMFVLVPFDSLAAFGKVEEQMVHDTATADNPAYDRIESSLLRAFEHMPRIEVPERKDRIFELRRYESPSEAAGQKKIEMFNQAGEIDIFKRAGARPVFFGESMIGDHRPNLTYMLCFDNMEAHDTHWKAFGSDPDWHRISTMPEYLDAKLISKITRTFLTPAAYSQV